MISCWAKTKQFPLIVQIYLYPALSGSSLFGGGTPPAVDQEQLQCHQLQCSIRDTFLGVNFYVYNTIFALFINIASSPVLIISYTQYLGEDLINITMPSCLRGSLNIVPRVLFNLIDFRSSKHNLMRLQPFGLLQELPAYENDWENTDH